MPNTGTITGLNPATDHVLDAVHVDDWGNMSAVVSSAKFKTDAAPTTDVDSSFTAFASGTSGTFSSQSVGTAAANRAVYAFVASANGEEPTECTIDGVPATLVTFQQVLGFTGENITVWRAALPTGTSADFVISGGTATNYGLAVAAVYGKAVVGDAIKASNNSGNDLDLSADVATGDDVLGAAFARNGDEWSWIGLTEYDSGDIRSNEHFSVALATAVTAATPRTITAVTGAGSTAGVTLVLR